MKKEKLDRAEYYEELFEYSIAHLNQKRLATAQSFWAMSFESYIKKEFSKIVVPKYRGKPLNLAEKIDEIWPSQQYKNKKRNAHEMRDKRNDIIHDEFMSGKCFDNCLKNFLKLLGNPKTLKEIKKSINAERQTYLALKFKDRVQYEPSDVGKHKRIEENDFYEDSLFEEKIWALKYKIEEKLGYNKECENLKTGLVSDFGISSEWIWIPVGYKIGTNNVRVKQALISILIFRDKKIRIYLDFGTKAIKPRKKYYRLLSDNLFRGKMQKLCEKYENIEFWNIKHYSVIVERIPIVDFITRKSKDIVDEWINNEKKKINELDEKNKYLRSNILLFGSETKLEDFPYELNDLTDFIIEKIKDILPFLKEIENR